MLGEGEERLDMEGGNMWTVPFYSASQRRRVKWKSPDVSSDII